MTILVPTSITRINGQFSCDAMQIGAASNTGINEGQIVCDDLTANTLNVDTLTVETLDVTTINVSGDLLVVGTSNLGDVSVIGNQNNVGNMTLTGNLGVLGNVSCAACAFGPNYSFVLTNTIINGITSAAPTIMTTLGDLGLTAGHCISVYRVELLYTPNGTAYTVPASTSLIFGLGDNNCYVGGPTPLNGFIDSTNTTKNSIYISPNPTVINATIGNTTQAPVNISNMISNPSTATKLYVLTNKATNITGLGGNLTVNFWWNIIAAPYN